MRVMRPCRQCGKRYAVLQGPDEKFTCPRCTGDNDDRYTLTQRGWCEAMGISSAAAEVLRGVD